MERAAGFGIETGKRVANVDPQAVMSSLTANGWSTYGGRNPLGTQADTEREREREREEREKERETERERLARTWHSRSWISCTDAALPVWISSFGSILAG